MTSSMPPVGRGPYSDFPIIPEKRISENIGEDPKLPKDSGGQTSPEAVKKNCRELRDETPALNKVSEQVSKGNFLIHPAASLNREFDATIILGCVSALIKDAIRRSEYE